MIKIFDKTADSFSVTIPSCTTPYLYMHTHKYIIRVENDIEHIGS